MIKSWFVVLANELAPRLGIDAEENLRRPKNLTIYYRCCGEGDAGGEEDRGEEDRGEEDRGGRRTVCDPGRGAGDLPCSLQILVSAGIQPRVPFCCCRTETDGEHSRVFPMPRFPPGQAPSPQVLAEAAYSYFLTGCMAVSGPAVGPGSGGPGQRLSTRGADEG